jgi:hypothetical protein
MEFTSKVVKGGRKSPVCFCCEKQFDPNSRPAVALYNRQLIPNPKADPRRFRQAKAYVPEPYDAIIAVCNDCVPWGGKDPLPILKARLVKDYDKPGYSMDPTLAARVMHPAGRA